MKHVVFLGSETGNPININTQVQHLNTAYRACNVVNFDAYPGINTHNLSECIAGESRQGDILHISSHGDESGIYVAHHQTGEPTLVYTAQLETFLEHHNYKVVYVDACRSMRVVEDLARNPNLGIRLAIGFDGEIDVTAAYLGSRAFHNILAKGGTYEEAVKTLRETVHLLDLEDRLHVVGESNPFIKETLLPMPEIIARFAKDQPIALDKDGLYHLEFGAYGFDYIEGERCVVSFFSDDDSLVGGAFTTVESGTVRSGQNDSSKGYFWTNNYNADEDDSELWSVNDCDFSIYMSYFYDGEYDIVRSSVKKALLNYYASGKFNVSEKDRGAAMAIIDDLP